jgi:hypothetical protein
MPSWRNGPERLPFKKVAGVPRPEHPDKDIEAAVRYAEAKGWRVTMSNGHAWGRLYCPGGRPGDCILSVWSTPSNPFRFARQIRQRVDACAHYRSGP